METKINNIVNQIKNDFDKELKEQNKELQEVRTGKKKARVFLNEHQTPLCVIPMVQEKRYYDIKEYTEISKEEFKKVEYYANQIKKLIDGQTNFIRSLIK